MILRYLILSVLLTCSILGMAQSSVSISGVVKDELGNPVQYAAILILTPTDSTTVDGCITDSIGKYRLSIKKQGNYLVKSQMLGYRTFCEPVTIVKDHIHDITLHVDAKELNEVKVIADRFKYDDHKYTVNMVNNPLAQGKNITEVIKYLPGITKLEDVLYVNGEIVSEIYIDHRKVVDFVELEALQASEVLKIEVVSDSGAKLRADKSKAVIKISLKKDQKTGYLGNLGTLVTFGKRQHSERITFPFSYQKGKLNIYNYIRLNHIDEPYLTDIHTSYKRMDKIVNTSTENRYKGQTFSNVLSLVYDINKKQNIGVSFNTIQKQNKEHIYSLSHVTGEKEYSANYLLYGNRNTQQYQSAVNYNIALDEQGSSVHFIGDYLRNKTDYDDNRNELYSAYFSNDTLVNQTGTESEQMKVNVDIDICRWKNTNVSLGGDAYTNKTSNDIDYFRKTGLELDPLQNLCDDFRYKGTGLGVYSNWKRKMGRTTLELACRLQQDKLHLTSYREDISKHTYLNLFPELGFTYIFHKSKNLHARFYVKRGMDAIRYSDMNPIRVYASEIYYERGNPDLRPVTWLAVGTQARLTQNLNFSYRYTRSKEDVIPVTFVEDAAKGITYRMPVNAGDSYSHSVNLNYNQVPIEWWTLNATLQGYLSSFQHETFRKQTKHVFFSIANDFRLSSDCGLEVSFFIEKGMHVLDTYYHSVYNLDWRFYTYFFNKKLMCSISGNNVLYRRRILSVDNEIYDRCEKNVSRRDFASIALTWKFNSKEKIQTKRTREVLRMQNTTIGSK